MCSESGQPAEAAEQENLGDANNQTYGSNRVPKVTSPALQFAEDEFSLNTVLAEPP